MTRVKSLAGLPVEQHDSPNKGGAMTDHRGVVLHIAQGTYRGTINWQLNPDQRYGDGTSVTTSSTFVVGRERGEWAQMVDSDRVAWCQRSGSYTWLSVELAGYAPNPPSAWQVEACAQILAWAHREYGVPVQVATTTSGRGLGHHSMDNDTTVEWGHDSCPGVGVINAKDDIVARAKAILAGDQQEDDMTEAELRLWFTRAVRYAARPDLAPDDDAAALGRLTRDSLREIVATEGTNAGELAAGLSPLKTELDAVRDLLAQHQSGALDAQAVVDAIAARLAS